MGDKPFFVYFAPGATHAPHHVRRGVVGEVQGQVRPRLGQAARGDVRPPEGARRDPARGRADRPARGDPRLGRHPRRPEARPARQMEVYAGFLEHTDHHVGRLVDALEDLGILEDTLVYYIIGDNGASAKAPPNGCFNELVVLNGASALETTEFMVVEASTSSARRRRTTTTRSAGRTRWTRPTSGRSRSPHTGAERATARSSTGRRASRRRARSAASSTT